MASQQKRILVIDDEPAIRRYLSSSLLERGYHVLEAENGKRGLQLAAEQRPDLVILDLGLPDLSGLEVLKKLREWSQMPVLILTVQSSDQDKVQLLDAGADDYLTKPFSLTELTARLRVMERHRLQKQDSPIFKSGWLEIDFAAHSVLVDGEAVRLTHTEYEILRVLAQNAGKLVTQRQLLLEIWGAGSVDQTHYLRVYITHIRKKIEKTPSTPQLLITEPGVGYRLVFLEA